MRVDMIFSPGATSSGFLFGCVVQGYWCPLELKAVMVLVCVVAPTLMTSGCVAGAITSPSSWCWSFPAGATINIPCCVALVICCSVCVVVVKSMVSGLFPKPSRMMSTFWVMAWCMALAMMVSLHPPKR